MNNNIIQGYPGNQFPMHHNEMNLGYSGPGYPK